MLLSFEDGLVESQALTGSAEGETNDKDVAASVKSGKSVSVTVWQSTIGLLSLVTFLRRNHRSEVVVKVKRKWSAQTRDVMYVFNILTFCLKVFSETTYFSSSRHTQCMHLFCISNGSIVPHPLWFVYNKHLI